MPLPLNYSLNAFLMLGMGAVMLVVSVYLILSPGTRVLAAGLFITGAGCLLCGITDGFSDYTPRGMAFRKLGFSAFLIGLLLLVYSAFTLR